MEEKKIIAEPQDRIGEVCIADEVVAVGGVDKVDGSERSAPKRPVLHNSQLSERNGGTGMPREVCRLAPIQLRKA